MRQPCLGALNRRNRVDLPHTRNFVFSLKIVLKVRIEESGLPSACSFPKMVSQSRAGPGPRQIYPIYHLGAVTQAFATSSVAFAGALAGRWRGNGAGEI